mgnify:CR=1 FL=1
MKMLICDDQEQYGKRLKQHILKNRNMQQESWEIVLFSDSKKLYEEMEHYREYDVIFLDIEMPEMNGFDLAKKFKQLCPGLRIVFISSYEELVFSSFVYRPFYFLRKSKESQELPEILNSICRDMQQQKGAYLALKTENDYVKIYFHEIYYMESERNRLHIHTGKKEYIYYKSMKTVQELLPEKEFLKCHGSFLVNVFCIKEVQEKDLLLLNGERIPVSRTYRKYLIENMRKEAFA